MLGSATQNPGEWRASSPHRLESGIISLALLQPHEPVRMIDLYSLDMLNVHLNMV
jgi:hypothetical protein